MAPRAFMPADSPWLIVLAMLAPLPPPCPAVIPGKPLGLFRPGRLVVLLVISWLMEPPVLMPAISPSLSSWPVIAVIRADGLALTVTGLGSGWRAGRP